MNTADKMTVIDFLQQAKAEVMEHGAPEGSDADMMLMVDVIDVLIKRAEEEPDLVIEAVIKAERERMLLALKKTYTSHNVWRFRRIINGGTGL